MTAKLFSELSLSPEVLKAVDKLGFEQASPIQAEAIPVLMTGKDVVGQSQTGSGKTAAFGIPAVEKVDPTQRTTQVLILCPTRELAVQVSEEIHKLAFFKRGIHALPIYGGQSYERQFMGLKQGAQIVIGTPGRVMDHMRRGTLRLDSLKMVILDEADVMLNMGFREDIELILESVPKERQTVFFSATMPRPIRDLIEKYSREPVNVRIEQKAMTVATVDQVYYEVDRRYKIEALTRLIDIHDLKLGIIFCNTKRMVDELADHLNAQGYSADRLHGDMTQMMRDRVMGKFRKSGLEFLVATDVAARGIDVDDIQVVFNYDLPYDVEDYVHRIGRTGRAGRSGRAISFVAGRELFQIRNIERYTNTRIQRGRVPSQNEVTTARTDVFLGKLRTTLAGEEFRSHLPVVERLLEEGFVSTDIAAAVLHHLAGGETPTVTAPKAAANFSNEARGPRPAPRDVRDDRPPARPAERSEVRAERPAPIPAAPPQGTADSSAPAATDAPKPTPPPAPASKPAFKKTFEPAERPVRREFDQDRAPRSFEDKQRPKVLKDFSRERAPGPYAPKKPYADQPGAAAAKPSRRTPTQQTRLYMNVGAEMGVQPGDVVGAILGETGLPGPTVGVVDIRERHLFVDVASEHANSIIAKLNRTRIKGNKLKVKIA